MLRSLKPVTSHEDYFIQRYEWLHGRALRLTNRNPEQAEDLVHDAFIQFTLKSPELTEIENADAYLNRMLRNMYLSNVRRANLIQELSISIAAYDSAEIGLRVTAARDQIKVQDELRQICQYACARKENSKAGSTLILRFFHSYYPSEIAQVLRCGQRPVYDWLKIARREARLYLDDPASLKFIVEHPTVSIPNFGHAETTAELLRELRQAIFASKGAQCLSGKDLRNLYGSDSDAVMEITTAAHIVSCPVCLDEVNRLLGLPPLSERFLTERLGRETRPPDDPTSSQSGGGERLSPNKKQQRRLKEVIEHRPQELRILANGFLLGSQHISGEFNKQTLGINIDEPVGFIEVFSEQWIRLLFFDVEQPINGEVEQQARAEFNGGRALTLNLSFRGNWPVLDVVYHDPTFDGEVSEPSAVGEALSSISPQRHGDPTETHGEKLRGPLWILCVSVVNFFKTFDSRFLLRPAAVTAILAALLLSVTLFMKWRQPAPSLNATDLLSRSVAAEETAAASRDTVLHRTLTLEVLNVGQTVSLSSGPEITHQRIEVWQNPEKGISASRLYDERNNLVAGAWRRSDGSRVVFNHGAKLQPAPASGSQASPTFETAWQLLPSAKEFAALVGQSASRQVEERGDAYVVSAKPADDSAPSARISAASAVNSATLVLNRANLRAVAQTLIIRQGDETREYHFTEIAFEQRATSTVAPAVFEPDPALLSTTKPETLNLKPETAASAPLSPLPPVAATAELEVEVLQQLNQANALLGEQISLNRTAEGKLSVQGVVETEERKTEILRALSSFKSNPAIKIDVVTVAEAVKRQKQSSSGPVNVTTVEVNKNSLAVEPELRSYFSKRGVGKQQLDEEIRRFSDRALHHSFEARRHALALKQIAERFSAEDLRNLDDQARDRWRAMISEHARAFAQETASLRRELEAAFPTLGAADQSGAEIASDADLVRAATRLFALGVANDESVRRSFSLYAESPGAAPVKTAQFWKTLLNAEGLARSMSRGHQ